MEKNKQPAISEGGSSRIPLIVMEENLSDEFQLIRNMKTIKCSVLETGLRPVKMKHYFCSCDPNKIDPICEECAVNCHKNHILSAPIEGNTICACGLKAHNIILDSQNMVEYNNNCYIYEIFLNAGIYVFYINRSDKKKLCMFCNAFCSTDSARENFRFSIKSILKVKNNLTCCNNKSPFATSEKANMDNDDNIKEEGAEGIQINHNYKNKTNKTNDFNSKVRNFSNTNQKIKIEEENIKSYDPQNLVCECRHENHSNIKNMLEISNYLGLAHKLFDDLNANQILNLIFISENLYRNNYSLFEYYALNKFNFRDPFFKIDQKIYLTNYYYSIMNFYNISKYFEKHLRYTSEKICGFFNFQFIGNLINLEQVDNSSNWSFYNNLFGIFEKCFLGNFFSGMTKFVINDLENLSIYQRLCFLKHKYSNNNSKIHSKILNSMQKNKVNIQDHEQHENLYTFNSYIFLNEYILKRESNIINFLLKYFDNIVKTKISCVEGLELLFTLFSIFYRLSSYYLFDQEQKFRFIQILENCIKVANSFIINFKDSEKLVYLKTLLAKIFLKVIKTIIYLAYEENDKIIYEEIILNMLSDKISNLKDDKFYKNLNFFHMKNEFGMSVSKVFILILDLTRQKFDDYENYPESSELRNVVNDIFRFENHLLSFYIRTKDSYMVGLRGLFNENKLSLKFLQERNVNSGFNFLLFNQYEEELYRFTNLLENAYYEYFNYIISLKSLFDLVLKTIESFFKKHSKFIDEPKSSNGN